MAKLSFFINIAGDIDSMSLWKLIERYKVNLTAVIDETWVYGDNSAQIVQLYVDVRGGVYNEPKKEEDKA